LQGAAGSSSKRRHGATCKVCRTVASVEDQAYGNAQLEQLLLLCLVMPLGLTPD
jgi:hypothetical protein